MKFEGPTENTEKLSMEERLTKRDPHLKISIAGENPQIGEVTLDEFFDFDPQRDGDVTYAASAFMYVASSEGKFTKEALIHKLSEKEVWDDEEGEQTHDEWPEENVARATTTIDNMLNAGLFEIRNDRVYSNMEMFRR
jgi:hypothetical protein